MKKVSELAAALLLLAALTPAGSAAMLGESWDFTDERMTGVVDDAQQFSDGVLVLGSSLRGDNGWMEFIPWDGSTPWLLEEEGAGVFSCPAPLDGGGFSALVRRRGKYDDAGNWTGTDESLLAFVDAQGDVTRLVPLPWETSWLIRHAGGYYAIGTSFEGIPDGEGGWGTPQGVLTSLDSAGGTLWSYVYTNQSYSGMTFNRGVVWEDSLILIGRGYREAEGTSVGLVNRLDLSGEGLWTNEVWLGSDSFISDVCVSPSGLIAGCYADVQYDEEDGAPTGRKGGVFCFDMDGGALWDYPLEDGRMADYIMPLAGGFLLGSRGLDIYECPWLGEGWLMMLDNERDAKASDSLPDIGGGKFELMGIGKNAAGRPLLCGVQLDGPGSPGAPYLALLEIPWAQ